MAEPSRPPKMGNLARTLEKAGAGAFDAVPSLTPGATLVRDWYGETRHVEALAERGRRYRIRTRSWPWSDGVALYSFLVSDARIIGFCVSSRRACR